MLLESTPLWNVKCMWNPCEKAFTGIPHGFHVIYQTLEPVFHRHIQTPIREVKYDKQRSIFDKIWSVWIADETLFVKCSLNQKWAKFTVAIAISVMLALTQELRIIQCLTQLIYFEKNCKQNIHLSLSNWFVCLRLTHVQWTLCRSGLSGYLV